MRIEKIRTKKYPIYLAHRKTKIRSVIAIPDIDFNATGNECLILSLYKNDQKLFEIDTDPEMEGVNGLTGYEIIHLLDDQQIVLLDGDILYLSVLKRGEDEINLTLFIED